MLARGHCQPRDIVDDLIVHRHPANLLLHGNKRRCVRSLLYLLHGIFQLPVADKRHLTLIIRVTDCELHQKSIHLRVWERLCTGRADLVLRSNDAERIGQRIANPVHSDLLFLHGLQKRRLRLAGGAVDLVAQQQVGIRYDARHIAERILLLVVHGKADDIRRQNVRGKLDPAVAQPKRFAERDGKCRFSYARHIIQQNMPAAEHRHQHLFYNSLLAGQCLLHFPADRIQFLIHCSYILFGRFFI